MCNYRSRNPVYKHSTSPTVLRPALELLNSTSQAREPTTAHASSESTGLGTWFHSLGLTFSLIEMGKKITVIIHFAHSLPCYLSTAQLPPLWAFNFYLQAWVPSERLICIFQCQNLFLSLNSRHAKRISPSCTHYQLLLRIPIGLDSHTYSGAALCLLQPWQLVPRC